MSLFDHFRAFEPGGMKGLSEAAEVPLHTLYRVAHAKHSRLPVRVLNKVSRVLQVAVDVLTESWHEQRQARKSA